MPCNPLMFVFSSPLRFPSKDIRNTKLTNLWAHPQRKRIWCSESIWQWGGCWHQKYTEEVQVEGIWPQDSTIMVAKMAPSKVYYLKTKEVAEAFTQLWVEKIKSDVMFSKGICMQHFLVNVYATKESSGNAIDGESNHEPSLSKNQRDLHQSPNYWYCRRLL